ncbi:MAG TPA: PASTA domain-containing protein, partial [Mycobacteriales bacterium]|nr:PASTA domain-containing protein [Mycobacteriales bacterium]
MLIEAITGRVPFAADTTIATLMARVDTPVDVPAELGPLRGVLARAGRLDPGERPDAGEFVVGLLAAAEELPKPERLPLAGATSGSNDVTVIDRDPTQLPPASGVEPSFVPGAAPAPVAAGPRRRRRWPFVLAAILAVLALTAGGAFAWTTLVVPSHKLPNLVDLPEQQATQLIQSKHWKVRRVESRKDGSVKGNVIAQDPAEGKSLQEKKTVTITVSLGNTLVGVPQDLGGKSVDDATAELAQAGLKLGTQTPQNDETVPEGIVISLDPSTPPQLPKGEPVNIIVSGGPQPRTVPAIAKTTPFDQASKAIKDLQLVPQRRDDFSDDVPQGQIVGTDPPAGTQVARGSTVTIVVSKGLSTI